MNQRKNFSINLKTLLFSCIFSILISACSSTLVNPNKSVEAENVTLADSYLKDNLSKSQQKSSDTTQNKKNHDTSEFQRLNRLSDNQRSLKLEIDLSAQFAKDKSFQISLNELPLNEFLHYVLGDLLNVSYLLETTVKANLSPITLELKDKISAQRLFLLTQQILSQYKVALSLSDDVFYAHPIKAGGSKTNKAFGFGAHPSNVPNVSSDIIQLIPVKYGTSTGLRSTIAELVDAQVSIDPSQGLVTVKGKREQILRALSLLKLLDSKGVHSKAIALLSFKYINSETFIEKVSQLLAQEGIITGSSRTNSSSVQFVPIEHLGKVVVFSTADEILDRIEYWTKQLDKPATGSEQSFYIYHPKYARASDLGQSLAPLLTKDAALGNTSNTSNDSNANDNKNTANAVQTINGDNIRVVVDGRANALIFYSTGKYYQELQPIISKLDIMPKQVMLEVVIAEVKLTGSFSKGVEYALKSGAGGSTTESFNFSSEAGFNYSIVGLGGSINLNLKQTDGLINVLSRPTILVRDGVAASLSIGDDIPTIGATTSDPDGERQTTTLQYRKTGIDLVVTPTINAQGTVIMSIEQNISNVSPDGSSIGGSPSIFERKISTEVVAGDGQTVMLGGLISENKSSGATSIPFLGSLPVLGHLFRNDSSSTDKTELVILVTPRIVNSVDEWDRVQESFVQGLENIKF